MKKIFIITLIIFSISSCQKDDYDVTEKEIKPTVKVKDSISKNTKGIYNPVQPGFESQYDKAIKTIINNPFYSERFSFENKSYILDTCDNDRLYMFESTILEYNLLCANINSMGQITELYILDFPDGMDFELYMELGYPIAVDVYTVDNDLCFNAEIDLINNTYSILNYNREMVQPPSNGGSVLCGLAVYTAALPWVKGTSMIPIPWVKALSYFIEITSVVVSAYICS